MKPIIGIISRNDILESGNKVLCIYEDVINSVEKNGGIPVGILLDISNDDMNIIIDRCDGIIFQGGDYFNNNDLDCLKYIYKKNIPVLGICLGMQLMGNFFSGKLINIHSNFHKQKKKYVHRVYIDKNSKLYSIFKCDSILVNSRHKSTVINPNIDIVGISEDGIIEAIEDKNKKFFIGVQWHPESMISYDVLENSLFNYFINVCRK